MKKSILEFKIFAIASIVFLVAHAVQAHRPSDEYLLGQKVIGVWQEKTVIDAGGYCGRNWAKRSYEFRENGTFEEYLTYFDDQDLTYSSGIKDIEKRGSYIVTEERFIGEKSTYAIRAKTEHGHEIYFDLELKNTIAATMCVNGYCWDITKIAAKR